MEDEQPNLVALKISTGVDGACSVNSGWASTGLDGPDSSESAEVGNAAAMEELDLYLRLGEDCVEAVQRISSQKFNNQQCGYLADKLQMVVQSANMFLNALRAEHHGLRSSMDVAKVVEVFKFLLALAKQIENFVQGCCKDSWIQGAMTLTNVWEHVVSVGFNLELCRVAFCRECAATGCLTLDEVEEIHKVEVEVVKKKAFSDVDALFQKIALELPSLSSENKDLAFYLIQRLNQVKPVPGARLNLSESSNGFDIGCFGRLFKWVKPSGQLGRGASGTVDKAMWLGTPVAKKTFYGTENPDFRKEVEVLSPLSHPNVMSVFCSAKNLRSCSIIMELMDEDLHTLMQRRLEEKSSPSFPVLDDNYPSPFPILEAVDIMLQIGEGGKYLHNQRIVHRDLKSMNILAKNLGGKDLDGYVHVKVADFGLSRTKEKSIRYSSMTYNVGSSRWMPPELIRLDASDQGRSSSGEGPKLPLKCDVYSFGMVCFEILTGDVPFSPIYNLKEVKRRVMQGERPELPEDPQSCPPMLKELIERCWSLNPDERPTFTAICSTLKYLKYLLMRSCETIQEAKQSRLNHADNSDSMELLSNKYWSIIPHQDEDPKAIGKNIKDFQTDYPNDEDKDGPDVGDVEFKAEKGVGDGTPLHSYEVIQSSRGENMQSLTSVLSVCEMQVKEFKDLLPSVRVYRHQCTNLVKTLAPIAESNFERCHKALNELERYEGRVSSLGSQHFCIESLVGLAGQLQLVVDILRKCASENLHRTALELAYLPPLSEWPKRWSEFSLLIRNCEWSMDIVELAFHMLDNLLAGCTHMVQDVSFRWSEENCRLVLQAPGKLGRQDNKSVLDLSKELEAKDLDTLIAQLRLLGEAADGTTKWKLSGFLSRAAHEKANVARALSEKLSGPIPQAIYLPWTFRVDPAALKFKEYLDSGSAGMVGKYTWFGEDVAVKSVRTPGLSRHKFEEEASILAYVQHPNVVRIIGCGFIEKNNTGMLVMELMDHDLRTVIDSRIQELGPGIPPFSTNVAIDLAMQIAQAMKHLRDHRVLHRDLKAKNVLVNTSHAGGESSAERYHEVKLADFGLARSHRSSWVRTRMVGTTGWRAPEVFLVPDTEVTQVYKWPADVYSFAMTCYEILTGNLPFANFPQQSIHESVMAGMRPEGLDESDTPELLKELVKKCWATDPSDRPTFDEIVKSLWECRLKVDVPGFEHQINVSRLSV